MYFFGDVYRDGLDQRFGSTKDYGVMEEPKEEGRMKPCWRDARWNRFMRDMEVKSEVDEDELMEIQGPIPRKQG